MFQQRLSVLGLLVLTVVGVLALLGSLTPVSVQAALLPPPPTTHTVCASGCNFSSIQAAIDAAGSGDTLQIAGETFTEVLTIDKDLILVGAGPESTTVRAAANTFQATTQVITVTQGISTSISGMLITFGYNQSSELGGGGILNYGQLYLDDVTIQDNFAAIGAAIYNYGSQVGSPVGLQIKNSLIQHNTGPTHVHSYADQADVSVVMDHVTIQDCAGVGFVNESVNSGAVATLSYVQISNHRTSNYGIYRAGAILNRGPAASLVIMDSILSGNVAEFGGGIVNGGTALIQDTLIYGNEADFGGGISTGGNATTTLERSQILANQAEEGAGIHQMGLSTSTSAMTITQSTIAENISLYTGGGITVVAERGQTNIWIADSTIAGNSTGYSFLGSGGGLYIGTGNNSSDPGNSLIVLSNTTIANNVALKHGGGIYHFSGWGNAELILQQVTVSNNQSPDVGGVYHRAFKEEGSATLRLMQTILADSRLGSDCSLVDYATIIDDGYNLVEDNSCGFSGGMDPQLRSLADRGGPTWTMIPYSGSPIIDAVPAGECASGIDQRGIARPQGAGCDIGAVEYERHYPAEIYFPSLIK